MLQREHRGFRFARWLREGFRATLAIAYMLRLQRFRDFCEGCDGFARVCLREGEGGAASAAGMWQRQRFRHHTTLNPLNYRTSFLVR